MVRLKGINPLIEEWLPDISIPQMVRLKEKSLPSFDASQYISIPQMVRLKVNCCQQYIANSGAFQFHKWCD